MRFAVGGDDHVSLLVAAKGWLSHMSPRAFLSFSQIFSQRRGETVGIRLGHITTIGERSLTRPHAFFIGALLSETRAAVAQW